ncbi:MAG: hypothetical protein QGG64_03385, partial [Candidatus Latescibacteria bacterium]|nr:hypothetical protein [Candidatus Latescibacterota bacterium]
KGRWEWWYWASYETEPYGPYHSTSISLTQYAQSSDGENWEIPNLGLYEWQGSKNNNVACDPSEGHRTLYHIIRDEHEKEPSRRYKGLFGSKNRTLKVSPDGFDWTPVDAPSIPSQDESHFTFDEQSGHYLALVKQKTDWGRSVWLSTSTDFIDWSEPELIFHSDKIDQTNRAQRLQEVIDNPDYLSPPLVDDTDYIAEIYQMPIMPYEGIYIGFPVLFNPAGAIPPPQMNYTAINQIELTVSHDLHRWERVANRDVFIGVDPWDGINYGTAQNLLCGRPHIHANREIWIYYNALRFRGHKALYEGHVDLDYFNDVSALCLAKLRRDGFVSLDALNGSVITTPFAWQGESLYVNAEIRGELRAELLDAETKTPLPGYQSIALQGNQLHGQLHWPAPPPAGKTICVKFTLIDTSLYAFWTR